jgi:hypothetical protein
MTRARLFALALLVGMSGLGSQSAIAQSGPGAPPAGFPGSFAPPDGFSSPQGDVPWYGTADEVGAMSQQRGPLVQLDGAFLRVEYLNWNIQKPGNQLLGAPVQGVSDPTQPFLAFAPGTSSPLGFAVVPSTSSINLGNMSGLQVTGGMSFIDDGSIEVSAFMLARKSSGFRLIPGKDIPFDTDADAGPGGDPVAIEKLEGETLPLFIATSVLSHGQVSDHLLLYNVSYQAVFQSQMWGGEANYLYDLDAVGFLQFRPLFGVRYINLTERLTQTGVFQDILPAAPVVTTIDAHTTNNLWGPQIGFRTSVVTQYLEVGLTPKLLFLGDTVTANVFTNHFRSNADPLVGSSSHTTTASFGSEVGAFAQINLSPNFSIRGGYNLLWLGRVTRPQKDVYYNDNGPLAGVGVHSQTVFSDVLITGFSVGAEFHF